jgi:hypothetical protein
MQIRRHLISVFIAGVLATSAWAQSVHKPLNLTLPPESLTAASSSAAPAHAASVAPAAAASTGMATTAASHASGSRVSQPGVYYGDTSGRMGNTEVTEVPSCDDATYDQPRVHGSVGMGVVGGSHFSGNYQSGTVHLSKAFGSCDHPSGGISISVGVSQDHFHGPRHGH